MTTFEKINKAHSVVSGLCDGTIKWRMSVPVDVDSDPDIVISDALHSAKMEIIRLENIAKNLENVIGIAYEASKEVLGTN